MNSPTRLYSYLHVPRNMTISDGDTVCKMIFSTPMTAQTNFTTTWTYESDGTTIWTTNSGIDITPLGIINKPTEVASGTAYASPLVVYWQEGDLSEFPSDYASSLASVIKVPFGDISNNSSTSTAPPANSSAPSANPGDQGSKLSPGAIAGISVGVVVLVISSVVLGLYLWRRQKQQRARHPDVAEMEASSRGLKHFVGGRWRAEQDGTSQPVEAGSTSVNIIPGPPVELDSTPTERIR